MVTVDTTDQTYPAANTDILAIESKIDALARQWLTRIQTNFWQFDAAVRTRVAWFNDNHYNPLLVYVGIQNHYAALLADLNNFKDFLTTNGFPLGSSYWQYYYAYSQYYSAYSDVAKAPALVQEEYDKGMIVGICDSVDDGDTIFVNGKEVRLVGINAVEKGTFTGGVTATQRMKELVLGKLVTVYFDPWTPLEMYRRVLGAVYLGDGSRENLFERPDWKSIFVNIIMVSECLAEPNDKGRNMYVDADEIKAAYSRCKLAESPRLARVSFKSDKTHARVYIDGIDTTKITPCTIDMVPGMHHLTLAADGFSALHEDIDINYDTDTIYRKLMPIPISIGTLDISTTPDDCDIIIDDMPQGVAPLIGVQKVSSAPVTITAVKSGYISKTISITPMSGRNLKIIMDPLEKA